MRRTSLALLFAFFPAIARAGEDDWRGRLAAAIERAVSRNPEIAAMESGIEAARHRVGQSAALPDTELNLALNDFPVTDFSLSRDEMTTEMVGLQQTFPAAGKRPARRAAAEAELSGAEASHEGHRLRLAAEVADVFFTLGEIDERIAILEASRDRLRRAADSVAERYRVGKGALADVLRANLDATAAEERTVALRGERRAAAARWNSLQLLPPAAPVEAVTLPPGDPAPGSESDVATRAEEESPAIATGRADVRRAEEELSLARLDGRPDITASAYYAHRIDFESLAGVGVSLTLPFLQGGRLSERRAEKSAELSAAHANLEAAKNTIQRGIAEAWAELDRSIEQARLYRSSILPQAETNARAADEAYRVGQVDFLTFSRAGLDRDSFAAELVMRRAAAWRALAALQTASGLPVVPGTPKAGEGHHE